MTALTLSEHAALCEASAPLPNEELGSYATRCNAVKQQQSAELVRRFPVGVVQVTLSNLRYEVHCERVLAAGGTVAPADLAAIPTDALRYDWFCFPNLTRLRPELRNGGR